MSKIDLKKFYLKTKNPYYRDAFDFSISYVDDCLILDEEDAINQFKNLIEPYNSNKSTFELDKANDERFIYLCNYLDQCGYTIDKFPQFLERPTNRWDISYNLIRNEIIKTTHSSPVAWSDRRIFISNLNFVKNSIRTDRNIEKIIVDISNNKTSFISKTNDEKLQDLCNCIEYLLKDAQGNSFKKLDYSICCGFIDDVTIKKYRNCLEIYRHATSEDIEKRDRMNDFTKVFLINYGILIISTIISIKNNGEVYD